MTTMNIGDRNSEFVRRYLALEKIRIVAEDLQGGHPRKVAFMPRTGQVMVKKLRLQQEAGVAEREQALARQTAEARAERLARARERVELFADAGCQAGGHVSSCLARLDRGAGSATGAGCRQAAHRAIRREPAPD